MIERYTTEEMKKIWELESKFKYFLSVELAVCKAYNKLGKIPDIALAEIEKKANFNLARIEELEAEVENPDYEKQAIVAIGSLYGVDIMNDNVEACRERLYNIWNEEYTEHCKTETSDEAREVAKFIISRNIINGNALTLMCVDAKGKDTSAPIVFSEWTLIGGSQMQRSDYTMSDLLLYNDNSEGNLFALTEEQKEEGGIFLRRYITHYKKVQDYGE